MIFLFPPLPNWTTDQIISDYTKTKIAKPHCGNHPYCVTEGIATVIYNLPKHKLSYHEYILQDLCTATSLVYGFNILKRDPQYRGKVAQIPNKELIQKFNEDCQDATDMKGPAYCYETYAYEYNNMCVHSKLNCITKEFDIKKTEGSCDDSSQSYDNERYSNNWILANFAILAYKSNTNEEDISKFKGWNYLSTSRNKGTGFLAHSFINPDLKEIVIAIAGTSPTSVSDLFSDVLILLNKIPTQYRDIEKMYDSIFNEYTEYKIMCIGHSLGGGLCHLLGVRKENITVVTFDTPGMLGMLTEEDKAKMHPENFIIYIGPYNFINLFGEQIVDPIQVFNVTTSDCFISSLYDVSNPLAFQTLNRHKMENMVKLFDPIKGSPINSRILNKKHINLQVAHSAYDQECVQNPLLELFEARKDYIIQNHDIEINSKILINVENSWITATQTLTFPKLNNTNLDLTLPGLSFDYIKNYQRVMIRSEISKAKERIIFDIGFSSFTNESIISDDTHPLLTYVTIKLESGNAQQDTQDFCALIRERTSGFPEYIIQCNGDIPENECVPMNS